MVIELALHPLHSQLRISDNGGTISGHQVKKQLSQVLTATLYLLPVASLLSSLCKPWLQGERWLFILLLSYTQILISKHSTAFHPSWCQYGTLVTLQIEQCLSRIPETDCCTAARFLFLFYLWPTEGFGLFLIITFT